MTFTTRTRRSWLRGILALAALTAAFALPSSAMALTPSITEAHVSAWAGESSTAVTVTFQRHTGLFGAKDSISGFSFSDSTHFTVGTTNCDIAGNPNNCTVVVTFNAPAEPQPVYVATMNLMSSWDGTAYDGVVKFYGYAGVKGTNGTDGQSITGPQGPQGPGCYVPGVNGPSDESEGNGDVRDIPEFNPNLVPCEKGEKGDKGDKGDTGAQGVKGDTGATGATGAAGPSGPSAAALVVTKVFTVRSSCMVKRNARKTRVAHCLVKVPKGTPSSKWELFAGNTRIGTGFVKAGTREFRVTKALPKTVGGWVTVKLTSKG